MAVQMAQNDAKSQGISKQNFIIVAVVGSLLLLTVVRFAVISNFDSFSTRYACINHVRGLNDEAAAQLDETQNPEDVVTWRVLGHVRSNKLGILNRDSASCKIAPSVGEVEDIAMGDVNTGRFYGFSKLAGVVLQIGLVGAFVRWLKYRLG